MGHAWSHPRLFMDVNMSTLFFTDDNATRLQFMTIDWAKHHSELFDAIYTNDSAIGVAYRVPRMQHQEYLPYYPVGMAMDRGFGTPTFGDYMDCYGNGYCNGLAGTIHWCCYCWSAKICRGLWVDYCAGCRQLHVHLQQRLFRRLPHAQLPAGIRLVRFLPSLCRHPSRPILSCPRPALISVLPQVPRAQDERGGARRVGGVL